MGNVHATVLLGASALLGWRTAKDENAAFGYSIALDNFRALKHDERFQNFLSKSAKAVRPSSKLTCD
jgi:hypothetical protein